MARVLKDAKPAMREELEAKLGHTFAKPRLLTEALTHGSLRHEQQMAGQPVTERGDNERLEFLGDAVVGLLVAESLFRRFPSAKEGELTRIRAALVSSEHLGKVGLGLELGRRLRMGRGEAKSGGRARAALLADCVEAVTAALYLDGGLPSAASFVERVIVEPEAQRLYDDLKAQHAIGDYKSALQELLQARGAKQPEYSVEGETGPDHRKRFTVEVRFSRNGASAAARGTGSTKKKAEQEAAKLALSLLSEGSDGETAEP